MTRAASYVARFGAVIFPVAIGVLGFGFALVPLARQQIFFYWDNARQHYPQTVFLHDALRAGHIPHWFPAVGLGFPTVAEGQAAHYHPLRLLLAWLFSPPTAFMWEVGAYLTISGLATYWFLRELRLTRWACLLGGVTQMFCGTSMLFVRNVALHRSLCMVPLALLFAERWVRQRTVTSAAGVSVVLALQLLSGHPTLALITVVGMMVYIIARELQRAWQTGELLSTAVRDLAKAMILWVLIIGFGFTLAAIQVIPTLSHARHSTRQGGLTLQYAAEGLPAIPGELPQAAYPYAYEQGDWPSRPAFPDELNLVPFSNMYIGILPLLLAGVALWRPRRWPGPAIPLAAALAVLTALALGAKTPLFPALWSLPGMNGMRYPSRFLLLASVFLTSLGAVGLHRLVALSRLRRGVRAYFPAIVAGVVVVGLLGAGLWVRRPGSHPGIMLSAALWAGAALLALLLLKARRWRTVAIAVVVTAALADLWIFREVSGYARAFPIGDAVTVPESAGFVKRDPDTFRTMTLLPLENSFIRNEELRDLLQANLSSVWGIDSADTRGSLLPLRYFLLREGLVWELMHTPEAPVKLGGILAALNVKYATSDSSIELRNWDLAFSSGRVKVWRNPTVLPRVFLVGQVIAEDAAVRPEWEPRAERRLSNHRESVQDWDSRRADAQIVDQILERGIDFRTTAVVDGGGWPSLSGEQPRFRIEDLTAPDESDNKTLVVRTDRPALVVVSSSYYPGWTASVNGVAKEIVRTNWVLQGVFVDAGESRIEMRYRTPGFSTGVVLSILSSVLLAAGLMLQRKSAPASSR